MLISHASDEAGGEENYEGSKERENCAENYQAVDELFELMTENVKFIPTKHESLTKGELVLLYKNMDAGTGLMASANGFKENLKRRPPNQRVETVVYGDRESDSDISEVISSEDLHSVVLFNEERIDLLNSSCSWQHTLCHKPSEVKMESPGVDPYDQPFLLKDMYFNEQQKSLDKNPNNQEFTASLLPATVLDYICCKRLQDNHNVFLENIIKYVKHTIDQLKKISNGDYLTEKAKEMWTEVENEINSKKYMKDQNNFQVLSSSTYPLCVERKANASFWNEIVHSELDITSLTKILEKKIVLEIPRSICGSYKLSSKFCEDDLIIRCRKDKKNNKDQHGQKRLNVVVKLRRSESGHVVNNIQSIVLLQKPVTSEPCVPGVLPLPSTDPETIHHVSDDLYKEDNLAANEDDNSKDNDRAEEENSKANDASKEENCKKTLEKYRTNNLQAVGPICYVHKCGDENVDTEPIKLEPDRPANLFHESTYNSGGDSLITGDGFMSNSEDNPSMEFDDTFVETSIERVSEETQCYQGCDSSCSIDWHYNRLFFEAGNKMIPPDDLRITMQRLNMQDSLKEDPAEDGISPKRSPTRCRIKSPYENKSYVIEEKKRNKLLEIRQRREKNKMALTENCKTNSSKAKCRKSIVSPQPSSSVTKLSITNKSFYNSIYGRNTQIEKKSKSRTMGDKVINDCDSILDNPNDIQEIHSLATMSVASNNIHEDFEPVTHIISSKGDIKIDFETDSSITNDRILYKNFKTNCKFHKRNRIEAETKTKKTTPGDFRRSIDIIYKMINKNSVSDSETNTNKEPGNVFAVVEKKSSISQCSDSGTSFEHRVPSSNASYRNAEPVLHNSRYNKCINSRKLSPVRTSPPAISKVIISAKSHSPISSKYSGKEHSPERPQSPKSSKYSGKRDSPESLQSNPLSAISQLLHEFDGLKKGKAKTVEKKTPDSRKSSPTSVRLSRRVLNDTIRDLNDTKSFEPQQPEKLVRSPKDKKTKQTRPVEQLKLSQLKPRPEDRQESKISKKQMSDVIDEYKEAKGEAIRGPSKLKSNRLNTLAQPKKYYVQAHMEQHQARYGKNYLMDRMPKRATASTSPAKGKDVIDKNKQKNNFKKQNANLPSDPSTRFNPIVVVPIQEQPSAQHPTGPADIFRKKKGGSTNSETDNGRIRSRPTPPKDLIKQPLDTWVSHITGYTNSDLSVDHDTDPLSEMSLKLAKNNSNMVDAVEKPKMAVLPECNEVQALSDVESKPSCRPVRGVCLSPKRGSSISPPSRCPIKAFSSITTIAKTKRRRVATGTFQNRLIKKLKKLTLSPKQSQLHTMVLQSGDARTSSIIFKTKTSHELKITNSKSTNISDLKVLSDMQKPTFDWTFTQIPMQVTTVGYSFDHTFDPQIFAQMAKRKLNCNHKTDKSLADLNLQWLLVDRSCQCLEDDITDNISRDHIDEKRLAFNLAPSTNEHEDPTKKPVQNDSDETDKWQNRNHSPIPYPTDPDESIVDSLVYTANMKPNLSPIAESDVASEIRQENVKEDNDAVEPFNREYEKPVQEASAHDKPHGSSCITNTSENNIVVTTSLDILVGLLNEIKNISKCQTKITNSSSNTEICCDKLENMITKNISFRRDCALNTDSTLAFNVISMTSLDRLRHIDSNPSLYSYLMSNDGDVEYSECTMRSEVVESFGVCDRPNTTVWPRPILVDKEISVQIPETQLVSKCTSMPLSFLPATVNNATCTDKQSQEKVVSTCATVTTTILPVSLNRASSSMVSSSSVDMIDEPSTWPILSAGRLSTPKASIIELQTTSNEKNSPSVSAGKIGNTELQTTPDKKNAPSVVADRISNIELQTTPDKKNSPSVVADRISNIELQTTPDKKNAPSVVADRMSNLELQTTPDKKNAPSVVADRISNIELQTTPDKKNAPSVVADKIWNIELQTTPDKKNAPSVVADEIRNIELQTTPDKKNIMSVVEVKMRDSKPKTKEENQPCKRKSKYATQPRQEKIPELSQLDKCSKLLPNHCFRKQEGDFERIMKIKRDVLVTMYSILVFTIFAALSLPQVTGIIGI